MSAALARLAGGVVVSCQAPAGGPLDDAATMAAFARAAVLGGAAGIRANGPADIAAIRQAVGVPVIGLHKVDLPGSPVRITPTLDLALQVAAAGADVIAVDATARPRPEPLERLIPAIRERTGLPVLADVSSLEEALAAVALGADAVATTMSGYTQSAPHDAGPDLLLVAALAEALDVPVIAEGRIGVPGEARRAIELGAFAVVVGTAVTRPDVITRRFVSAVAAPGARSSAGAPVLALAIDIGGTKVAVALVDGAGRLRSCATAATPRNGAADLVAIVSGLGQSQLAAASDDVVACGVATAGEVDPATGSIVSSTATLQDWAGTALGPSLQAALGLPAVVENDGNAAALAEASAGAGRGHRSVLAVSVGTGVGGGIVIDGQIHRGSHGVAGGVGHLLARPGGRRCPCGARGCLEAYASGPAIVRSFVDAARRSGGHAPSAGIGLADIAALAGSADHPLAPVARASIDEAAAVLGAVLGGLVNALDPDVVVLGGGVSSGLGERFVDQVRAAIRARALPPARGVAVVPASLGSLAAVTGAGLLALAAAERPGQQIGLDARTASRPGRAVMTVGQGAAGSP